MNTQAAVQVRRDPWVRMAKRENISMGKTMLIRLLALVCALITGGLIILFLGHDPILVYQDMVVGSVGSKTPLIETIRIAIPLLIVALGISLAFKMRFWNIGGEGQILFGAMAASYFALFQYQAMPSWLLLIVMGLCSALAGGLAGVIPSLFKARWDTNETLFTLMINYIAMQLVLYLQNGPWKNPLLRGFPKIAMFEAPAKLPLVLGVHIGWIIALVLVGVLYVYLNHTKHGYEISVVGESPRTAKYAGMNVSWVLIRTMFLSGALCGLAGFVIVSGADYTLSASTTGGAGFTGITVAWLSQLHPVVMIVVAFFIAMLERGANKIQTTFKIPASAAEVLIGVILFFMLGCEFFINYKLIFRGRKERTDG